MDKRLLAALTIPIALAGCQTWGPTWSEVTGDQYVGGVLFRRPAIIEHIDNQGAFVTNPIKVDPGMHAIQVGAPTPGWRGGSDIKVLNMELLPCKRYYINAQFENNVSIDWAPVIGYVDTIAGCQVVASK